MSKDDRGKRQFRMDFSSQEMMENFKDMADELGVSPSHLAELFIRFGIKSVEGGRLGVGKFLRASKLPWLRDFDIDFDDDKFWND